MPLSLVGSEMCIRDSTSSIAGASFLAPLSCKFPREPCTRGAFRACYFNSVSAWSPRQRATGGVRASPAPSPSSLWDLRLQSVVWGPGSHALDLDNQASRLFMQRARTNSLNSSQRKTKIGSNRVVASVHPASLSMMRERRSCVLRRQQLRVTMAFEAAVYRIDSFQRLQNE